MQHPITIERQGSFFVGGRTVTADGVFEPTAWCAVGGTGQTYWVDQMYVQYQVPPDARGLPLVLVHGGGGSGRVWESTPDGREGYQTIFLRRGFAVYIVDWPRSGRSGFPSFDGEMGQLDARQRVLESTTRRSGHQKLWTRWRLGPQYPARFDTQAFPMNAVDQFLQHIQPMVFNDPDIICAGLMALLDKIGPAVLVTHSNSGVPGWLAGCRSDKVKGIVSYEPGFVFPQDAMPAAVPLHRGFLNSGASVKPDEFSRLANVPLQVVYGDNIPIAPVPDLRADDRRAQVLISALFVQALRHRGGDASALHLPSVGLRGNSHFMFSDLNNVQVANQLQAFLEAHRLA